MPGIAAGLLGRRASRTLTEASPRVVLRFAVYTAIALAIAGASMLWFLRRNATTRAETASAFHTRFVADTILRSDLHPSDFARPVTGHRLAALDALFRREVMTADDLRVKLYRPDGLVTYSSDHTLIGTHRPNPEVAEALEGKTPREVSELNHEGGQGRDVRVLETYTSVKLRAAETPTGVFERYQPYGPVTSAAWVAARPVAFVLVGLMLALYVSLFPILRRLTATLKAHNLRLREQASTLARALEKREEAEAALRRSQAHLWQAQKMEAVGQLAGGVAHDFNNHMMAVRGFGELVLRRLDDDSPLREDVEQIVRAGEQATAMTRQLLAFSRQQVLQTQVLDINTAVRASEKLLRRLIGEHIELVCVLSQDIEPVETDPAQLEQVIVNLVVNGRDAMPLGGRLTIETSDVELTEDEHPGLEAGQYVRLRVTDTGTGMDDETRSHIFEPFFTTKDKGKGTGLGLASVYGIVKQSGGDVSVESHPGRGTSFDVFLPAVRRRMEQPDEPARQPALQRGDETILLVEDEELVRTLERAVLEECGYTVLATGSPTEALSIAAAHGQSIDLLLTDVVMPELGGRELAERIAASHPNMKILYSSGYPDDGVLRHGVRRAEVAFLPKPATPSELAAKVREVLSARR